MRSAKARSRWSRIVAVIVFAALSSMALIGCAGFLMAPAAQPERADLILPLGGDTGARAAKAIELYREGYGKRVMLTALGPDGTARVRQVIEAGIPADDLVLDNTARNTWEEVVAVRRAMILGWWKHVIVVSDPPHMRRIQLVCERLLSPEGLDYTLVSTSPLWWDNRRWWANEASARFVFDEYVKLAYYFFRYPPVAPEGVR